MKTYRVEEYGAWGDGVADNTEFIQRAVDQCAAEGGGRVLLSSGTYVSGTIKLKSHVDFHIEEGAVLKGITDLDRYPEIPNMFQDGCNETKDPEIKGYAQLFSYRASNVRLTGKGAIDVGGDRFDGKKKRPFLLRIIESSQVVIEDLSFLEAAAWCCHLHLSSHITMNGVTIRSSKGRRNGDGLDVDSCSDVTITGCDINTNDDALCFKSTSIEPCRNITVTDCVLESHCSGVKFGSESVGDFKDISISGCTLRNCGVVAIKLTPVDGGSAENISFSHMKIENSTGPILVAVGNRGRRYTDQADLSRQSRIRNISFRNMDITTKRYLRTEETIVKDDWGQGIVVSGRPGQVIEDILFEGINVEFWGGIEEYELDLEQIPVIEGQYPECHKLGLLPAYGFNFQYAKNVRIENCIHSLANDDVRSYMWER